MALARIDEEHRYILGQRGSHELDRLAFASRRARSIQDDEGITSGILGSPKPIDFVGFGEFLIHRTAHRTVDKHRWADRRAGAASASCDAGAHPQENEESPHWPPLGGVAWLKSRVMTDPPPKLQVSRYRSE